MTITERVAYLKGLMEGMELDTASKEGKVLKAMLEIIDEMADQVADLEDRINEVADQVDEIDEDLSDVEDIVFDEDDDDDDDDECFECDEDDESYFDDDDDFYEVTCDKCGETTYITGEIVNRGEMECPNCGETIEFDEIEAVEECGEDCEGCSFCCEDKE